ncbi:uncharacterized protein N7503_009932 [Penicillium pulvis]|uniref:uncharacterized protein n=1 Tax=Penicillium pulvis TaxID=1562058 RepID=UPI002546DCE4|nr:uncharacterized protein N7503_009932 [Penicillium pulvis]KAJ5784720.1 hypothetical protein N7503_009932 [Penicillium pulvis]
MSTEAAPMTPPAKKRMTDWNSWFHRREWDAEDYLDQSDGLPNIDDVILPKVSPILTGMGNFEVWLSAVTKVLDSNRLMGLITRPRPLFLNEQSERWASLSLEVGQWMEDSIDETLYCYLEWMGEDCIYADAVVRSAKLLLQGKSLADARRMEKLVQLKPSDFDKPFKYVMAYADQFESACKHGINIGPYAALLTILLNFQNSKSGIYYKIHQMLNVDSGGNGSLAEWVTKERFQYYITHIIKLLIDDDQRFLSAFHFPSER